MIRPRRGDISIGAESLCRPFRGLGSLSFAYPPLPGWATVDRLCRGLKRTTAMNDGLRGEDFTRREFPRSAAFYRDARLAARGPLRSCSARSRLRSSSDRRLQDDTRNGEWFRMATKAVAGRAALLSYLAHSSRNFTKRARDAADVSWVCAFGEARCSVNPRRMGDRDT
jgi:hypothetical protein